MSLFSNYAHLVDEGQDILSQSIKTIIYQKRRDLFDYIDYNNNLAFLEPFVFAYFNSNNIDISLDQIVCGYIIEHGKLGRFDAFSDESGYIFLPEIGMLEIDVRNSTVQIEIRSEESFSILHKGKELSYVLKPIEFLSNSGIELLTYDHPYFKEYFYEWDNDFNHFSRDIAEYEIQKKSNEKERKLEKAFDLISMASPDFFRLIADTNKRIVLFDNLNVRNFVVKNMHGLAFIGASREFTEIYYLEELVHQCGHNVFNAATTRLSDFFKIDPETSLKVYSKKPNEYRSIYSTLHGLFTVAARVDCFRDILDLGLEISQRHELLGRLADLKRRFRTGLEFVDIDEVFTNKGKELYRHLDSYCENAFKTIDPLVEHFDYSNQTGYNFSYQEFLQCNPINKIPEFN